MTNHGGWRQQSPDSAESEPRGLSPPGWYPDPSGVSGQRYWDGNRWTEHVSGGLPPAPTVEPARPTAPSQTPPATVPTEWGGTTAGVAWGSAPAARSQLPPLSAVSYQGPTDGWYSGSTILLIWIFCCWPFAAVLLFRSGHGKGWKIVGGVIATLHVLFILVVFASAFVTGATRDRPDDSAACMTEARTVLTAVQAFQSLNGRLPLSEDELVGSPSNPGYLTQRPTRVAVTVAPLPGGGVEVAFSWAGECAALESPPALPAPLRG